MLRTTLGSFFCAMCMASAGAQRPDPVLFDSPWIAYDTATYPEGISPVSSVAGDLNGDGIDDLAAVSFGGTGYLSILLADGNGGYLPPETYELLLESEDLVLFDWDRDGDLDIAVSDTDRRWLGISISIWENDGDGGFTFFAWFDMGDHGPAGITAADFDGDGWVDIATANDAYIECNNTVSVLRNANGNGFHPAQVYSIAGCTKDIDSGDINGDGHPDLVIGHESNRWSILMNDEEGGFINMGTVLGITAGSIPESPTIHLGDIDRDADLDVFFSNRDTGGFGDGAVGLWRNNGDGSFASAETMSFNWYNGGAIDVNTADVTGDNWPDVLCATGGYGNWFLFESDGAGGFGPPRRLRAGDGPIDIETPDLDNDGDLDVVVLGAGSSGACVYLNPGDGSFVQPPALAFADPGISPAFTTNVEAGDIDADGDLDLVVGFRSDFSESFGITVRRNNGDGTFGPREEYAEFTYPGWITLADMDGDTDLDILYFDSNTRTHIRKNDGTGGFSERLARHTFSVGPEDTKIEAVDVDNDGDLDMVMNTGFYIRVSKNLGNDSFGAPYIAADLGSGYATTFAFGDFDDDGMLDLLTNSGVQAYAAISFGLGGGFYGEPFTVPTGRGVKSFGVSDLNHDGNLDFTAIYNLDEKGVTLRRGRGDGNFFLPLHEHGSFQWGDYTTNGTVEHVDVNLDGHDDVLFANVLAQDFSFWANNGDGTLERVVRYGAGHNVHDMAMGDFDGDGIVDVAMSTQVDNGRWFYTGVVIIRGLDPNGSTSQPAELTDVEIVWGSLLSGGLNDLLLSDDQYLRIRSQFGFSANLANLAEVLVGATSPIATPALLDVTFEGRLNNPGGTGYLRLRDWDGASAEEIDTFPIGLNEIVHDTLGVDAVGHVRDSDQRMELAVRFGAVATFSALGFDASIDHLQLNVR